MKVPRWLCIAVVLTALTVVGACSDPERSRGGRAHNQPHKATEGQSKLSGDKPEGEAARQQSTTGQPGSNVEGDVRDYYRAAAAGNYDYTYEHLTDLDQMAITRSEWVQANTNLQSDQGTYEITAVRKVSDGEYDVDLVVSGTPRTTRFVYATEAGSYKHELTGEEIVMFTDALSSASASTGASASASPETPSVVSGGTTVTVVDVVDGDTFDIDQSVQGMDRVRLIGIDTPEVYGGEEPCGQEASDFTTQRLEGQQVRLEIGEVPEDPYGRLLAYAFVEDEFFNETIVSEGLAEALSYPPNTKYDAQLEAAEATAKTPVCGGGSDASTSASASASPNPSGDANSKLNNGINDLNCEDLPGPVNVGANDEDQLDADGDGWGCD
jgi:endonuclease YncB( thermonuclease family)